MPLLVINYWNGFYAKKATQRAFKGAFLHMDSIALPPSEGFNHVVDGRPVSLSVIRSQNGSCVCAITNYGARIVSLLVKDKAGKLTDVALGYASLEGYLRQPEEFMGAVVGRCANRIAAGLFVLNGDTYALPTNNNHNTLHGGIKGLHARVWTVLKTTEDMLVLSYLARDGEEGFPGNLHIEVIYKWTDNDTLQITYHATTDKATLVNLSNHTYFNLSGEGEDTVLDHELQISANSITPVDGMLIPTGKIASVADTPFDFIQPRALGTFIETANEQLALSQGYDHNFVLNNDKPAVTLRSPRTDISMSITTDRPGMQLYSGNFLDGSRSGKSGKSYGHRSAIVLEPQGYPDAIHHPQFPSTVLLPGNVYYSVSAYRFSTTSTQ